MAHTANNEKPKDKKEVKKKYSRMEIFISNAFAQKRDTKRNDKSRCTWDFQNIQKWVQEKGDEEKERKRKGDGDQETREG